MNWAFQLWSTCVSPDRNYDLKCLDVATDSQDENCSNFKKGLSFSSSNRPFAPTSHMVQNPPYWMARECSRFQHKGIPTCQARLSFFFNDPV